MPPGPPGSTPNEVEERLKDLHDTPVDTQGTRDRDIIPLLSFLMDAKPGGDGKVHWFCSKADALVKEDATFLLRLFAYTNDLVMKWRAKLADVLHCCTACVRGLEEVKETSTSTYFGAFNPSILTKFWIEFEKWEVETIVQAFNDAGITPESSNSLTKSLSPVIYHMLSRPACFTQLHILGVIASQSFPEEFDDWPTDSLPPGLFLMLMHESDRIRQWAIQIASKGKQLTKDQFGINYKEVLQAIVYKLSKDQLGSVVKAPDHVNLAKQLSAAFPFSQSQDEIWEGVVYVLRLLPLEVLESSGLHRIVIGHLHDDANHFRQVLRCMVIVIQRLDTKLWARDSADYPQVVFDSIKDNPSYQRLLRTFDLEKEKPWFLHLFADYLRSIWDMPIFGEVLAKLTAFTCEELQHERFEEKHPFVLTVTVQILSKALVKADKAVANTQRLAILKVIDIHRDLFVAVALKKEYKKPQWAAARDETLSMIAKVLEADISNVTNTIFSLSEMSPTISEPELKALLPEFHHDLWRSVYGNLDAKDAKGVSWIIRLASQAVLVDKISKKATAHPIWRYYHTQGNQKQPPVEVLATIELVINELDKAISSFRFGLLDAVSKFANNISPEELSDLLPRENLTKPLMHMMLSPVEDLHNAAEALVGQTFDVDGRADCFRALLYSLPIMSYRGLMEYMSSYYAYASRSIDATAASKALVRCLTDVIEVLGNSPNGLLRSDGYIRKCCRESADFQAIVMNLWKSMTVSSAIIFSRAPRWAESHSKESMLEWMRDALIFARDLLDRRQAFVDAAIIASGEALEENAPHKTSSMERRMVENLQDILFQVQAWLRLTNEELLYQSFALLKSLFQCFRSVSVVPAPEALKKLSALIEMYKKQEDSKRVTMLNEASLAELEAELMRWDEDDEIEIISVSSKPKAKVEKDSSPEIVEITKRTTEKTTSAKSSKDSKQSKLQLSSSTSVKRKEQKLLPAKPTIVKREPLRGPKFEGSSRRSAPSSDDTSGSSNESEDSEDEKGGLDILVKRQLISPKKRAVKQPIERTKPTVRRQIKVIDDPMLSARNAIAERIRRNEEARRNAMRLKPDITPLHRTILSWNYDHSGEEPPYKTEKPVLHRVPDSFKDYDEYLHIFEPLLTLECWAQIIKSKEETPEVYDVKVLSRHHVDDWLDLELMTTETVKQGWRLSQEVDVVLLRNSASQKCIMGKVTHFKNILTGIQINVRCCTRSHNSDPGLSIASVWRISLVFSLSTLHREFAALMGLPYYDMAETILRPRLCRPEEFTYDEIRRAMESHRVNEPQAKAILSSVKTKGFSLIQGPPGTGKTWTICGLVGAFLSSRRPPATPIVAGKANKAVPKAPVEKILICAPSNAAIDEVAKRLIEGVFGSRGQRLTPVVVRVGVDATINASVKEISLDSLVDKRLEMEGDKNAPGANDMQSVHSEIESVKQRRQKKYEELQNITNNHARAIALEDEIRDLNAKRFALTRVLNTLRDQQQSQNRSADATRRRLRYEVLAEADVICSTLSGAGHEQLEQFEFSMVVIDEAAQSIELSSLIPLKYRCEKCIMVGDPQQLPPTVLSMEASKWGYNQSLFVRMQKQRPEAVHLLSIQYRMHPSISQLPSQVFYEGRLKDGPDMAEKTAQPWHAEAKFGVYRFFSVTQGREESSKAGHSLFNQEEVRIIVALFDRLRRQFSSVNFDFRVGIVSMYRAQVQALRRAFISKFGEEIIGKVDFNTVDGFQGQEKDVIILSCVRAGPSVQSVGFLADERRMNVAITRARSSLFIVGHAPTLQRSNATWRKIVEDARSRSCLVEPVDVLYFTKSILAPALPAPEVAPSTPKSKSKQPKTPNRKAVESASLIERLLTPKEMKEAMSRSKGPPVLNAADSKRVEVKTVLMRQPPNSRPQSGQVGPVTDRTQGQKRVHEGNHEARPPPNERADEQRAANGESSSSTGQKRPHPQNHESQTQPPTGVSNEARKAKKLLNAFKKRKNEGSSLFIKR